jgi:hypothetical protein
MKFHMIQVLFFIVIGLVTSCGPQSLSSVSSVNFYDDHFVKGSTQPEIILDQGSGVYGSEPWTTAKALERNALWAAASWFAPGAFGVNAAAHLTHYLDNTGAARSVDLKEIINTSPTVKSIFTKELRSALKVAHLSTEESLQFTTARTFFGAVPREESLNWYLAVGGFQAWSSNTLIVITDAEGRLRSRVISRLYLADRYNWDKGAVFNVGGMTITGESMGEYHRMGLAKEYDIRGYFMKEISWTSPEELESLLDDQVPLF